MSEMLEQVRQVKEDAKNTARAGGQSDASEELPEGSSPIEARSSSPEGETETAEETPAPSEGESAESGETGSEDDGEPIRIAGQTFKSQKEAFAWAEERERERELTEAHAAGIREALEATRQPAQPNPEPEDDFEQRFYANPKETLKEIQAKAVAEATQAIRAETQREKLWNDFLSEYPDIRRKDAERILNENWSVFGKITDLKQAMKSLAQRTRAEYEEIESLRKPRTVLADKKQVLSPSGGAPQRVTPPKKDDAPLDFVSQMKKLKEHR